MFNLSDQGGSLLSGVLQVPFYFTKLVTLLVKLKKRETDESHDTKFISDHPNEIILKLFEETTHNYYMTLQVRWESYYVLHCSTTSNIWGNLSVFLANYLQCNRHSALLHCFQFKWHTTHKFAYQIHVFACHLTLA